tara:strand:+ start:478 stop:948 length:471 start_codon:yes stop_codon:yes gene_type:complete
MAKKEIAKQVIKKGKDFLKPKKKPKIKLNNPKSFKTRKIKSVKDMTRAEKYALGIGLGGAATIGTLNKLKSNKDAKAEPTKRKLPTESRTKSKTKVKAKVKAKALPDARDKFKGRGAKSNAVRDKKGFAVRDKSGKAVTSKAKKPKKVGSLFRKKD